jgi:AcrR family transcriptional regulator
MIYDISKTMGVKTTIDLNDPRVRRTRRLLREALIGLILEKDYRAITIKNITDRAEVAYITFFRHYRRTDDLLLEVLQDGLQGLQGRIEQAARQTDRCRDEGRLVFEYVQKNADLFHILLNTPGALHIRRRFEGVLAQTFLDTCQPLHTPGQAIPPEIVASQLATMVISLIEWWLSHQMPRPVEEMALIYEGLILRMVRS